MAEHAPAGAGEDCHLEVPGRAPVFYRRHAPAAGDIAGTVVLLHGLASNATRWSEFVGATRLRRDHLLLVPDLRGHGRSPDIGPLGLDRWAEDLVRLLDREGVGRAVLVGHCLGATIIQRFALHYPERVHSLILVEPLFPAALRPMLRRLYRLRFLLRPLIALSRIPARLGLYRRRLRRPDMEAIDRETRALIDAHADSVMIRQTHGSVLGDLRNMLIANYFEALLATIEEPNLQGPPTHSVLAMLSKGSFLADIETTIGILERSPDCHVVQLHADHWLPTETPDEMRALIDDWVEGRAQPRGLAQVGELAQRGMQASGQRPD